MSASNYNSDRIFVKGNQLSAADRSVSGVVETLTFHNEENGFFVARVRVAGLRDEITVVGNAPRIAAGEHLEAQGRWTTSAAYGRQFKAEEVRTSLPADEQGLIKFLANALPGIGKGFALKLVQAFGTEVPTVIEKEPGRLFEVPGLGAKRAQRVIDIWKERSTNHNILAWLCGLGVSAGVAEVIHRRYGEGTRDTVSTNPYQLAEDIAGIGFKKADAISRKLGITPANPHRIQAAIRHVLREATDSGSCGRPRKQVREITLELLNFAPEGVDLIDREIQLMSERGFLVEAVASGVDCLFLAETYKKELEIAQELVQRLRSGTRRSLSAPELLVQQAESTLGLTLESSQRDAVILALQEPVAVITGGPGTGKTTITRAIVESFTTQHMLVYVCAPTGKAAKRASEAIGIEARTIHRTLEVQEGRFVHNRENPLDCDVLIVDELSMVDVSLFRSLLLALPPHTRLILVGDVDQLPSVGPGKVLADIIDSGVIPVVRLTQVFRQARESHIILNAHRVNGGHAPAMKNVPGADFGFFPFTDDAAAQESLIQAAYEMWRPGRFLPGKAWDPLKDVQVLTPMRRGKLGVDELNRELRKRLNPNPEKEMPFRDHLLGSGDKVIQTRNNYDKSVFNGEIGFIEDLDPASRSVIVDFDGRLVSYASNEVDQLRLAYAMTIHRSQGSEFKVVLMAISYGHFMMLKRNLLYTGITRARELMHIYGNPRAAAHAARNSQVEERYSKLRDWLRIEAREAAEAAAA